MEKIPHEMRWAITAKTLTSVIVSRMLKTSTPFLGKDEGILSLLSGWEKEVEIKEKIFGDSGRKMFPWIKETFNIPVDDALKAAKLFEVAASLTQGPEYVRETVEATPERVVWRVTKCAFMERWKEFGVDPGLVPCHSSDQAWGEAGLTEVDPKLTFKMTKAMPWGDPYCESVIEFSEE